MKAKYFIIVAISCLATLFISCSDSWPYSEEEYKHVWIDVHPSYISLDEDVFSGEFAVSSSVSWYIYDSPSWVNISSSYGYGYDNVSFTVDENDDNSTRYGYIKIRTDEGFTKEAEVEIAQPPTAQFDAYMNITNYSASSDWWTLYVVAASSRSWTISKSDSWVHLGSSNNSSYSYNGKGNENVLIYVDANSSSYSRSSKLTVKCGTKTKSITITQDGKSNKAPFVITSIEIGNTDYDGNVINNYGSKIYGYQTKYLKPKLYVSVNTSGTYIIYHKLYKPDGTLSTGTNSPSGYSSSREVSLYSTTSYVYMYGWGSNTAGHWSAGQYRWEFWYSGEKIGEKSFTIY